MKFYHMRLALYFFFLLTSHLVTSCHNDPVEVISPLKVNSTRNDSEFFKIIINGDSLTAQLSGQSSQIKDSSALDQFISHNEGSIERKQVLIIIKKYPKYPKIKTVINNLKNYQFYKFEILAEQQ